MNKVLAQRPIGQRPRNNLPKNARKMYFCCLDFYYSDTRLLAPIGPTACAPMAAYTWTPSRNPAARIPPVPCVLNKALLLGDIAGPTLFSVIGTPPWKGGTWRVPPARGPPPSVLTPGGRTGTPTPVAGEKAVSLGEGDQTRHRWHSWLLFLPFSAVDNNF